MMKICTKVLAILFALTMVWAGSAMALSISFDNGNDGIIDLTVNDDDGDGYVSFEGTLLAGTNIGQWEINSLAGISYPSLGTATFPMLDLFSLTVEWNPFNGLGGTIAVSVENTFANFDELDAGIKGFIASIGGTTPGSVDFSADINGKTIDIGWDDMSKGIFTFEGEESILLSDIPSDSPFTMSMTAVITQGWGATSFDAQIAPVPEPATMVLFGVGLIGIAGVTRKKLNLKRPE